jgi:hypothetical protein
VAKERRDEDEEGHVEPGEHVETFEGHSLGGQDFAVLKTGDEALHEDCLQELVVAFLEQVDFGQDICCRR